MSVRCCFYAVRVAGFSNCFKIPLKRISFSQQKLYSNVSEDTISYKFGSALGQMRNSFTKYMMKNLVAKNLYESCADNVKYADFFKVCGLPDTMQSWIYITQLHVWMVLVCLKPYGAQGKSVSYKMVEIMWQDFEQRIKLLGVSGSTDLRENMEEITQQFFGLIVAFDEALLSHDTVLASTLWRNMFIEPNKKLDIESLALLVEYIRKQVYHLESHDIEKMLITGEVTWLPLIAPIKDA